jgi:hypothetical protein
MYVNYMEWVLIVFIGYILIGSVLRFLLWIFMDDIFQVSPEFISSSPHPEEQPHADDTVQ